MQFNFLGHQNAPKSKIFLALLEGGINMSSELIYTPDFLKLLITK